VKDSSGATLVSPISENLSDPGERAWLGVPVLFKLPASGFAHGRGPFVAVLIIKEKGGKEVGTTSAVFAISHESESEGTHREP